MVISGAICAAAGAAYALLFGYVGATFASIQYSILPLLWVLLGGAATTLGPLLGTLLMFYLSTLELALNTSRRLAARSCRRGAGRAGAVFPKGIPGHDPRKVAEMAAVSRCCTTASARVPSAG
jgi:ABC-type branched-subunit amino acid transport system permease subunit